MGTIVIAGLRELGVHGVLPEEQSRPQPFEVDVELEVDLEAAGESDDLDDTVDYSAVAEAVSRVVASERYQLLERLATRIAEVCRADDRVARRGGDGAQAAPAGAGDGRPRRGAHRAVTRAAARTSGSGRTSATGSRTCSRGRRAGAAAGVRVVAVSPVYETDAGRRPGAGRLPERGGRDRHRRCAPTSCSRSRTSVEAAADRVRAERWGPRTLDVDVLLVGDERVDEPDLVVPHPRMCGAGVRAGAARRPRPGRCAARIRRSSRGAPHRARVAPARDPVVRHPTRDWNERLSSVEHATQASSPSERSRSWVPAAPGPRCRSRSRPGAGSRWPSPVGHPTRPRPSSPRRAPRRTRLSPSRPPVADADLVVHRARPTPRSPPSRRAVAPSAASRRARDPPVRRVRRSRCSTSSPRRAPDVEAGRCTRSSRCPSVDARPRPAPGLVVRGRRPAARRASRALAGHAPVPCRSTDADRARYHAAACVASNHLVALLGQVERLAADAGVPLEAFLPLVRATLDNVDELGPARRAHRTGRSWRRRHRRPPPRRARRATRRRTCAARDAPRGVESAVPERVPAEASDRGGSPTRRPREAPG